MSSTPSIRPYALSIAGFDPSGGAGIVADAKAMEAQGVYGLTVATAITVQHEAVFERVDWLAEDLIMQQLKLLLQQYAIAYCKIGLMENWPLLQRVTQVLRQANPTIMIVVDPIFRASAGFDFDHATAIEAIKEWLPSIDLLTPNAQELARIGGESVPLLATAQQLAQHCAILYKGGHNKQQKGVDVLLQGQEQHELLPPHLVAYEKHGSGCVLSASIVAQLAKGHSLLEACRLAKAYTTQFLASNPTLLGYHYYNKKQKK